MIKELRRRFIFIIMACISFIFILILLILNISMTISGRRQGYAILWEYAQRKEAAAKDIMPGDAPIPPDAKPSADKEDFPFRGRIFENERNGWLNDMRISYVFYDLNGEISQISVSGNPELSEEILINMADAVMKSSNEQGAKSGYLYLVKSTETETQTYFLDFAPERSTSMRLMWVCLWIGLAGILILLIPVIFLSRWVSKPVQQAFDKQKQFIADASHELKTPLTIITTNAEVLKGSLPDNKWLTHILDQTERMKILINNLLELARLDSYSTREKFITFDLSKSVKNSALSFESIAYEYGKTFTMEIEEGLSLYGNESSLRQLVTILLDNAFKYSDDKGTITLKLGRHNDKKELLVRNTGNGISAKDQKHIFERFYRCDSSRSRESGGYGLGLSIAQSIVEAHKGHIRVKSDGETYTAFYVLFS